MACEALHWAASTLPACWSTRNPQLMASWCPAEITVEQCNCLQQYKHTDPVTGMYFEVQNGSCINTNLGDLPWCYVSASTCSGQPLLRNGYFWDNCYPQGALACASQHVVSSTLSADLVLGSHKTASCDLPAVYEACRHPCSV